jgi:hypothetical protein
MGPRQSLAFFAARPTRFQYLLFLLVNAQEQQVLESIKVSPDVPGCACRVLG